MFGNTLDNLKKEFSGYGALIESMIEKSVKGLIERDRSYFEEVMNNLEKKANEYDLKLDNMCINAIAKFEPKAKDLRVVMMIYKMNSDLERIGDLAVNICESGEFLIARPEVKPLIDIPRMAEITQKMLNDSINTFFNEDSTLARDILKRDSTVDLLRDQVLRELILFMIEEPKIIERAIHLLRIARSLERIGDLATNIAEDVIFMVEGEVVKHRGK